MRFQPGPGEVKGSFFKKGVCAVCRSWAERHHVIIAPNEAALRALGAIWQDEPIRHKRCETPQDATGDTNGPPGGPEGHPRGR